jgi:type I restriction enzyme S subunit
MISGSYKIVKCNTLTNPKFIYYNYLSIDDVKGLRPYYTGLRKVVRTETFLNLKVRVPPLQEQQQISDYLDYKISRIDTLLEKTQQKIELLKEQRTSLINTTVTKGLNPNVEMKDSGVEWIGEIPSGWNVKRLKYISKILPSNVNKHIFPEEIQVRLCNYTDVYYNELIDGNTQLSKGSCNQDEYNKFWLREGDVIITKDSETSDDIGIPTEVKEDLTDVVCGYHLTLIRPLDVVGSYIFRFIQSDRIRRYFEINSDGVTRFGLGKPTIQNMYLPIPPLQEQQKIVDYLDLETSKIDKLVENETKRIVLLKEYRQSLISEVVTGKVDVRDEVLV